MRPVAPIPNARRLAAVAAVLLVTASSAVATPTQQDVFRSIQSNVDHPIDGTKLMAVLSAVAGSVVLGVVINRWRRYRRSPARRARSGPALLLREIARATGLRRDQVRQLRALNARLAADGLEVEYLATLLLCPSLIRRAERMHADPATAVADAAR